MYFDIYLTLFTHIPRDEEVNPPKCSATLCDTYVYIIRLSTNTQNCVLVSAMYVICKQFCQLSGLLQPDVNGAMGLRQKIFMLASVAVSEDANGEWRKLHNEELHSLYRSHNSVKVIKPRRLEPQLGDRLKVMQMQGMKFDLNYVHFFN